MKNADHGHPPPRVSLFGVIVVLFSSFSNAASRRKREKDGRGGAGRNSGVRGAQSAGRSRRNAWMAGPALPL